MSLIPLDGLYGVGIDDATGKPHWMEGAVSKGVIDFGITGSTGIDIQGAYDATTNTPDLTTSPNAIIAEQAWYVQLMAFFLEKPFKLEIC
jgi:hypothetical protein